jgi:adenylate cyclase
MKKLPGFFFILSFLFLISSSSAQEYTKTHLDSLLRNLSVAKDDTNKVLLYSKILGAYGETDAEKGLQYVQPALDLAQKLNFKIAWIKTFVGRVYWKLGKMDTALKFHFEALKIYEEKNSRKGMAFVMSYIGQDYGDGGNYPEAIKYLLKANKIYQEENDKENLASQKLLISFIYERQGNYPEASKANLEALIISEELKDDYGAAIAAGNLAGDYIKLDKYKEAIPYLLKGIKVLIRLQDYVNLAGHYIFLSEIYSHLNNYSEALRYTSLSFDCGKNVHDHMIMANAKNKAADINILQNNFAEAVSNLNSAITHYRQMTANHLLAAAYSKLSICEIRLHHHALAKTAIDSAAYFQNHIDSRKLLSDYLEGKQLYDSLTGNWKEAYLNHYQLINIRDSIYNSENTKKILQNEVQYEFDKKEAAIKAEQEKKDIHQRTIRNSIGGVLAGSLVFLVVIYRQRNKISKARKRSDELLLNILPVEVAEELKEKGEAEAKHFDEVTVMFTDFKGFTQISEKLSPQELVSEIHSCFKTFDYIIGKYNIEKIKTIGDSYMCAGGLPVANKTNAEDVVNASLEILHFMQKHLDERKNSGKEIFEIRIGIHTGPVVAGIVGVKKFAYDIWGDTVNIAARMEQNSEAGKINISGATYELVKDKFICTHRGKIQAKNKGEIDMYFVEQ